MPSQPAVLLTPSISLRLPCNSYRIISFADPHPLTPVGSILYENSGGGVSQR